MNAISSAIVEAAPSKPAKSLITKIDIGLYVALILLEVVAALAWYRSFSSPYNRSWADPTSRACGRTISAEGRFLWQRGEIQNLKSSSATQTAPLKVVAGSNSNGERASISCGPAEIIFTMPESGRFFGYEKAMSSFSDGAIDYTFEWKERTFKYSFLVKALGVIFVLSLLEPAFRLIARRFARRSDQSTTASAS
jgi:hypothetical protein